MSFETIMKIAGQGMSAQGVRLNTVASNLANAESIASSETEAYHARHPVFQSVMNQVNNSFDLNAQADVGVKVNGIIESQASIHKNYQPDNPLADKDGYVYSSNVNRIQEMADMISASRDYRMNVEMMLTVKNLIMKTINIES